MRFSEPAKVAAAFDRLIMGATAAVVSLMLLAQSGIDYEMMASCRQTDTRHRAAAVRGDHTGIEI